MVKVAIGRGAISGAKFLDHGLVFALQHGPKLQVEETGLGKQIFRTYTRLVLKARSLHELKSVGVPRDRTSGRLLKCDVIESEFANVKHFYRTDIRNALPDKLTWAKGLGAEVGVNLTDAQANQFGDSLDGLYAYERWLRTAMASTFKPEKNENDRMDMNQLFYLADPSVEFVTCEKKIRDRISASHHSKQIVLLKELLDREQLAL